MSLNRKRNTQTGKDAGMFTLKEINKNLLLMHAELNMQPKRQDLITDKMSKTLMQ